MVWSQCVIDASMGVRMGLFTFCPIEGDINGDFSIVTGMSIVSTTVPNEMRLVAIVHEDGQDAVDEFCRENEAALALLV